MCGINGFIHAEPGSENQNRSDLKKMNSLIRYRGPDDEGNYTDEYAGIGMRRLSIIDLSTGNQPIFNENKTKFIVFNGEIYNFHELHDRLISCGHVFTTRSDTETILHAYEEYGTDCLSLLNGMFSFAIYDITSRELFIARDRAGEKPLYYYKEENLFVFASELKSILKVFDIKKEISKAALNMYLSLTYIPAPYTIFENIYKLEAGSFLNYKDGSLLIRSYWNVTKREDYDSLPYQEYKRMLREYLMDSVERQMISDVPLGAFLSGGIDSSIITGLMSKLSSKPVETFTIGFHNREFDESERAKLVSAKNKTNHHLFMLDYEKAFDSLNDIISTFDEPFADSSAIPTYIVSKFAAEYVKVVLTGDAGDELFGGYSKYLINFYADRYAGVPEIIRKQVIERIVTLLPDRTAMTRKVKKVIFNANESIFDRRYNTMLLGFNGSQLERLLTPELQRPDSCNFIRSTYDTPAFVDDLTKTLYTDFKIVLEGDMLAKVDRMSMLNSIETRVPLLDKQIIELAFNIPPEYKIRGKQQKYILKDTFSDIIPEELLQKGKRGFAVPIGEWFRGPLKGILQDLLSEEFIQKQGIFKVEYVKELLASHFSGKENNYSKLWTLYVFQKWYQNYYL